MKKAIFMILLSLCLLCCFVLSSCETAKDNDESAATTADTSTAATSESVAETTETVATSNVATSNETASETVRESLDEEKPITDGFDFSKLGFVDGDPIESEAQFDEILAQKLSYEEESGSVVFVTVTVYIQLDDKAEDVYDAKTAIEASNWEYVSYKNEPIIIAELPEPYDMTYIKALANFDAVTSIRVKVQVDRATEDIIWNP